jgi:hypothetical protein
VLVYENPYANKRLPPDIFNGPFDMRWGPVEGQPYIDRLYVGSELAKLEVAERQFGLNLGPMQSRKRQKRK